MSFFIYGRIKASSNFIVLVGQLLKMDSWRLTPKHTTAPFNQKETLQTNSTPPFYPTHRNEWLMVRCSTGDENNQPTNMIAENLNVPNPIHPSWPGVSTLYNWALALDEKGHLGSWREEMGGAHVLDVVEPLLQFFWGKIGHLFLQNRPGFFRGKNTKKNWAKRFRCSVFKGVLGRCDDCLHFLLFLTWVQLNSSHGWSKFHHFVQSYIYIYLELRTTIF